MSEPNGNGAIGETEETAAHELAAPAAATSIAPLDRAELAEAKANVDRTVAELERIKAEGASLQLRARMAQGEHAAAMKVLEERRARIADLYEFGKLDVVDLVSGAIKRVPSPAETRN